LLRRKDVNGGALVCTINSDVYDRILIDISEPQICGNDKFLGLET